MVVTVVELYVNFSLSVSAAFWIDEVSRLYETCDVQQEKSDGLRSEMELGNTAEKGMFVEGYVVWWAAKTSCAIKYKRKAIYLLM